MATGDAKKAAARPAAHRVMDRVIVDDETGCWMWPGATAGPATHRYGSVGTGSRSDGTRRNRATHIVTWEHFEGPVPEGLELDHLCRVTLCCNPGHLEPVTHAENLRRADWSGDRSRRQDHARTVLRSALARKRVA